MQASVADMRVVAFLVVLLELTSIAPRDASRINVKTVVVSREEMAGTDAVSEAAESAADLASLPTDIVGAAANVTHEIVQKTANVTNDIVQKTTAATRLIFGVHPWTMAVIACTIGSALTVFGFILQKQGALTPGDHWRIGDIVLTPTWLAGFLCVAVADFPLSMFVYSFAPISLIAPLSGITVILNLVVAPHLLRETVHCWPDLPATVLITVGIMLTSYVGAHDEPEYDAATLWSRFRDPSFLLVMCLAALMSGGSIYLMRLKREELVKKAEIHQTQLHEMLLPALAAAGAGLFSNVHLKAAGILLSEGVVRPALPWFVLTLLPAALQVNYLNRGMQLYPQAVFIPIYSACLMLMLTFGGAVFYQDYSYMQLRYMPLFITGTFAVAAGIGLFALRGAPAKTP